MFHSRVALCLALVLSTALIPCAKAGSLTTLYSFKGGDDGYSPRASLTYGNGLLYGTTYGGGNNECPRFGCGTIFSVDPVSGAETVLHKFTSAAAQPAARLLLHGTHLYGTTTFLNDVGTGSAFRFALSSLDTKFYRFPQTGGYGPEGTLIPVNGLLYGTIAGSGRHDGGAIYSLNPVTGTVVTLHNFKRADGVYPGYYLTRVRGALYGTTSSGGPDNFGTIFKYDLATSTYTVLHSFSLPDTPASSPLIADGKYIYGTTYSSANYLGTIFKLDTEAGTFSTLYSFPKLFRGGFPSGSIVIVGRYIYGTTEVGGSKRHGNIYRVGKVDGKEEVLYSFTGGSDGGQPFSGLTYENGSFYGVTAEGGLKGQPCKHDCGTVFKFTP